MFLLIHLCNNKIFRLSPDRTNGTDYGGNRGKSGHECRGNGQNALRNRECFLKCWNNLLL